MDGIQKMSDTIATEQMETKSTHRAEVGAITLEKHPDADTLSVVQIYGYTCVVRTVDWAGITMAAYLPPDSYVDVKRPEFAFLAPQANSEGRARIRAKRLRGVVSFGLLIPAPEGTKEGDDVAPMLDIQHYEPPVKGVGGSKGLYMGGEVASGPNVYTVKYDVDAFRRYHKCFVPGELVQVTEKLDGANARYVFNDGKMYCGSRTEWKKEYASFEHVTVESLIGNGVPEDKAKEIVENLAKKPNKKSMWWAILDNTPTLRAFCEANPGVVVYGEAFGNVGRIKYGVPDGFAAFDVMKDSKWVDAVEARAMLTNAGVPCVPLISIMEYDFDKCCALADGFTQVAGGSPTAIREGVVVCPLVNRYDKFAGRVKQKIVSATYLEKF
jgi:RNA ligase (TIGR02306 family)